MAAPSPVNLDYPPGATPLDADELASLIPGHLTTQAELNEWEQLNIGEGDKWARKQRKDILSENFLRQLHRQMFGETWKWAGEFRKFDKYIGVDWLHIGVELKKLLDDVRYQIEHGSFPADETAIRFHHRLVTIHAFPNGNGRHARMMADLLAERLGQPRFSWGSHRLAEGNLTDATPIRCNYITALQAADARDIAPLLAFARS
jgi:Fic-DOC domain mobile mystery protein B